jgi:hypothetical protein
MPLVWWVISRSSTAQTRVRQLVSPGKRPMTFVRRLNVSERPLEQVGAAPSPAMAEWVAQAHHERVEIVGLAMGGGGVSLAVELVDERLEGSQQPVHARRSAAGARA